MSRVLLCDDHTVFAEALAVALRSAGEDVVAVTRTVPELLSAVRTHAPDLVVIDVHFAEGPDGLSGTRSLSSADPPVRVLVLSGAVDAAMVAAAVEAGADGVVGKSEPLQSVLRAVRTVSSGAFYADPLLLRRSLRATPAELDRVQLAAQFLTPREREVLGLLVQGASTRQLVDDLGIGSATVRTHVHAVLTKLGARTRLEAVAMAVAHGLVPPPEPPG